MVSRHSPRPGRSTLARPGIVLLSLACRQGDVGIVTSGDKSSDSGSGSGTTAGPVDDDSDGFSDDDCDDGDPTVHPGAPEVADDGIDQDCDGVDARTGYGHRDDESETTLVGDFLIGNLITLDAPLTVTHLGYTVRAEVTAQAKLAVYAHDGGRPAELWAATAATDVVVGVNEVPVLEPVELAAGEWWVQLVTSDAVPIAAGPDELVTYREHPFGSALPDPYGAATDYEGARMSVFVMGTLP